MKKYYKFLVFVCLVSTISSGMKAQSSIMTYSPSSSTLIGDASRIGYHFFDYFTFYMRYNDSSYFCSELDAAFWVSIPNANRIYLPQDFVITDFKKIRTNQSFIGSYQDVGMYGWTSLNVPVAPIHYSYFQVFTLPAVDRLKRIATIWKLSNSAPSTPKAFSIGEKRALTDGPADTYFLEFHAAGSAEFHPYYYAPMPIDPVTHDKEIADDVITLDHYVILATRDTRTSHAPVNLRISDTTNVLLNTDIDYQWQFQLPSYELLLSELRMYPVDNKYFLLAYTKFNFQNNGFYLCIHRISLPDFLANNNAIVSYEIKINEDCLDLEDIVFKPSVKTMVVLLNGNGESDIYHLNPFTNINSYATKLHYPDGNLYSLDTIGDYYQTMPDCYIAMGGKVVLCQTMSNGGEIEESCLGKTRLQLELRTPPIITIRRDPLTHYSDIKDHEYMQPNIGAFDGWRTCVVPQYDENKH